MYIVPAELHEQNIIHRSNFFSNINASFLSFILQPPDLFSSLVMSIKKKSILIYKVSEKIYQ